MNVHSKHKKTMLKRNWTWVMNIKTETSHYRLSKTESVVKKLHLQHAIKKHNKAQNQIRNPTIRHSSKTEKDKQQQGTTANREHGPKQQKQQGRTTWMDSQIVPTKSIISNHLIIVYLDNCYLEVSDQNYKIPATIKFNDTDKISILQSNISFKKQE